MPQIDAFTFLVPAADQFIGLAPQLATRYVELSGGSAADAEAFGKAVIETVDRLSAGHPPGIPVHLSFAPDATGVRVEIVCADRHESVDVTIPVAKR